MERAIHDESWAARLARSVAATLTAGLLVAFVALGTFLLLAMATDRDPTGLFWGAFYMAGMLFIGVTCAGLMLGLAMAVPVHVGGRWLMPRGRGMGLLAGAVVAIGLAIGATTLGSDMGMSLSIAALLAATALGGLFFTALFERWAWVEPCGS